jgi:transcriptional regulator NrdR family protein
VGSAIERIDEKLLNLGLRDVPSARIGELVMRELKKIDKVAYVRFASVYRSFEDIDEFKTLVGCVTWISIRSSSREKKKNQNFGIANDRWRH